MEAIPVRLDVHTESVGQAPARERGSHRCNRLTTKPYFHASLAVLFDITGAVAACDKPSAADRALLQADAEVFETVVRSETPIALADSAVPAGFLRVDARPAGDTAILTSTNQRSTGVELNESADSLSASGSARISEQRKEILKDLHVEEGGPFFYPGCGGIRARRFRDSVVSIGTECPSEAHRYVTIGLPYRAPRLFWQSFGARNRNRQIVLRRRGRCSSRKAQSVPEVRTFDSTPGCCCEILRRVISPSLRNFSYPGRSDLRGARA